MIAYKVTDFAGRSFQKARVNFDLDYDYILSYEIGKITKAPEGSLGIFLFSNVTDAKNIYAWCRARLFRVKTIGARIKRVKMAVYTEYKDFYTNRHDKLLSNPIWKETILYPAVEVLEELSIKLEE